MTAILFLAAAVLLAAAYFRIYRPWQLRWGATDEEIRRPMPGDSLVRHPTFNATRAVTVHAAPEHIWPWLVQIGFSRAGWYSYDWVDNFGRPSAERIIPEFQHIQPGDLVPLYHNRGFYVKEFQPNRWVLWDDRGQGGATWCWGLYPTAGGQIRLISRVRVKYVWTSPAILFHLLLDAGDIIMMRKCMLGIKRRAETLAQLGGLDQAEAMP